MEIFIGFGGKLIIRNCFHDKDDVASQEKEDIIAELKKNFSICCDRFIVGIMLGVSVL